MVKHTDSTQFPPLPRLLMFQLSIGVLYAFIPSSEVSLFAWRWCWQLVPFERSERTDSSESRSSFAHRFMLNISIGNRLDRRSNSVFMISVYRIEREFPKWFDSLKQEHLLRRNDTTVDLVLLNSFSLACNDVFHLLLDPEPTIRSDWSDRISNARDTYCFTDTGFVVATVVVWQSIHDHLGCCRSSMGVVGMMNNNCIWRGMSHSSVTKQDQHSDCQERMNIEEEESLAYWNEDWPIETKESSGTQLRSLIERGQQRSSSRTFPSNIFTCC